MTTKELAAKISHDLSSPLTSMRGALKLLREIDVEDENFEELLSLLEGSLKRLSEIEAALSKEGMA